MKVLVRFLSNRVLHSLSERIVQCDPLFLCFFRFFLCCQRYNSNALIFYFLYMKTFTTSYTGFPVDTSKFEERDGMLPNNADALTKLLSETTCGILLTREDGLT